MILDAKYHQTSPRHHHLNRGWTDIAALRHDLVEKETETRTGRNSLSLFSAMSGIRKERPGYRGRCNDHIARENQNAAPVKHREWLAANHPRSPSFRGAYHEPRTMLSGTLTR